MFLHEFIQHETDDSCWQRSHDDFLPKFDSLPFLLARLRSRKGIEFLEIEHDDGHDGAELNNHEEHVHELLGYLQLDELIYQDHVSGARDRQPLRQSLNHAEQYRLQ